MPTDTQATLHPSPSAPMPSAPAAGSTVPFSESAPSREQLILEAAVLSPFITVRQIGEAIGTSTSSVERMLRSMPYLHLEDSKKTIAAWVVDWDLAPATEAATIASARSHLRSGRIVFPDIFRDLDASDALTLRQQQTFASQLAKLTRIIQLNPEITIKQMAEQMDAGYKTIQRYLEHMPFVSRLGSTVYGVWVVDASAIPEWIQRAGLKKIRPAERHQMIRGIYEMDPSLTQMEIASLVGCSQKTVSRAVVKIRRETAQIDGRPIRDYVYVKASLGRSRKRIEGRACTIIKMIQKNNKVTTSQMAEKLGLSIASINRELRAMPGILHMGSTAAGHWKYGPVPEGYSAELRVKEREEYRKEQIKKVAALIEEHPFMTIPEIGAEVGIGTTAVSTILKELGAVYKKGNGRWIPSATLFDGPTSLSAAATDDDRTPINPKLQAKYDVWAEKIKKLVAGNPSLSISAMAKAVGIGNTALARQLNRMGMQHVGSKNGGHWELPDT